MKSLLALILSAVCCFGQPFTFLDPAFVCQSVVSNGPAILMPQVSKVSTNIVSSQSTWSITGLTFSGNNTYALVYIMDTVNGSYVTNVTFNGSTNGVSLLMNTNGYGGGYTNYVYGIASPPNGTVSVDMNASSSGTMYVVGLTNVSPSLGSIAYSRSSGAFYISDTISGTLATDLLIDALYAYNATFTPFPSGPTVIAVNTGITHWLLSTTNPPSGGTVTMGWTNTASSIVSHMMLQLHGQ